MCSWHTKNLCSWNFSNLSTINILLYKKWINPQHFFHETEYLMNIIEYFEYLIILSEYNLMMEGSLLAIDWLQVFKLTIINKLKYEILAKIYYLANINISFCLKLFLTIFPKK